MLEAILCAASLSLCYTATCYGIDECIGSCWCMGDSKYKDSTLHIQAERAQIQWRRPSLGCCFHEDYNIMAFRICINRFWLVCGQAIILIGFPLLHMYSWCQSSAMDTNCHTDERLYSFHEISMICTNITKYTVQESRTEKFSELIHSICPTSSISYQSQWFSTCLATEGTWQGVSCMQIWCTRSFSPIHHVNISLGVNFVEYVCRQTKIHIAIKHPDGIVFFWCSFSNQEQYYDVYIMMSSRGR